MTRRAWWLLGLNLLIPGTAQLLAGSRRWGRFAVGSTFTLWAVALAAGILFVAARPVALKAAAAGAEMAVAAAEAVATAARAANAKIVDAFGNEDEFDRDWPIASADRDWTEL